mmetsp:Transcript_2103/g.4985  ORF Transcript_2103/g.4985 Transcript_2103/m.4985 type:complete len:470 (+) Transcript_2103:526-1935(+)
MGQEGVERGAAHPRSVQLLPNLLLGLAHHERLGLCEKVGEQNRVVLSGLVLRDTRRQEVRRDDLRTLMQELVEGVLPVGPRLAPDNRARRLSRVRPRKRAALAVALHVALLEVGGEAVHVLVVRQHRHALAAEEVVVPHAKHRHHHRKVLRQRRLAEVLVHSVRARQQLRKILITDADSDGGSDRAPERVAPPDPVPEPEHVVFRDAKRLARSGVGRDGRKMLLHRADVGPKGGEEPRLGRVRVQNRLLGGEGLRADEEEGGLSVDELERLGHVRPVHVADEEHFGAVGVGFQRLCHHHRPEVRPANPNVHHMGDGLAGVALALPRAYRIRERLHLGEHGVHVRHHVLAVDKDRAVGAVPQRHVQDRAVLGDVDGLAGKHRLTLLHHPGVLGEGAEELHRLGRDAVLAVVQQNPLHLHAELLETGRVFFEEGPHVDVLDALVVLLQRGPRRLCVPPRHDENTKSEHADP